MWVLRICNTVILVLGSSLAAILAVLLLVAAGMWGLVIVVASGGALGCMARHGVNRFVHQYWPLMRFPAATLIVNLVGCCVIGALAGLIASGQLPMRIQWREFVFVGMLGGFTTFSTFGLDTITLVRTGDVTQAFWNIVVQVAGGLAAVYAGLVLFERPGPSVH